MAQCAHCGREFPDGVPTSLCAECRERLIAAQPQSARPRRRFISVTYCLIAINVIVFIATALASHHWTSLDVESLVRFGANFGPLTLGGEPWRLLTSMFLHGGLDHIALNMWALFILGTLAEVLFGRRSYIFLYLCSGIIASIVSVWWHFHTGNAGIVGVGASGAIFGVAGALLPAMAFQRNERLKSLLKGNLVVVAIFVIYNVASGFRETHIDNSAHLGGLAAGLLFGLVLPSTPGMNEPRHWMRRIAVFVAASALAIAGFAWVQRQEGAVLQYAQAQKALKAKQYPEAIDHLQRSLQIDPRYVDSHYMLGLIYLEQEKNVEAREQFSLAAQIAPDWANAFSELCIASLRLRDIPSALTACKRSVELDQKDPDKFFNLGLTERAAGDISGAVQAFTKAQQLRPGEFDEESLLGETLAEAGRTDEAIEHLKAALKAKPADTRTRILLIRLFMSQGRRDEARAIAGR